MRYYRRNPGIVAMAAPLVEGAGLAEVNSAFEVTVRTVFPETWIWQLAEVGYVNHPLVRKGKL